MNDPSKPLKAFAWAIIGFVVTATVLSWTGWLGLL